MGGGTGMGAFGFKGGIGTSSRCVDVGGEAGVLGVLVQSNFGGRVPIDGLPMHDLQAPPKAEARGASPMMLVATDLPRSNRLLNRVARRTTLSMARTGSSGGHGSDDYVIALSTTYHSPAAMAAARCTLADNERAIDVVFQAVADATEEAILNSMLLAHTVVGGDGHTYVALPLDIVLERLRRGRRL